MKVVIILGTRPEIIKMAPVIREFQKRRVDFFILHTGQHYDFILDKVFFSELELSTELVNLDIRSGTHSEVTAKMLVGIEEVLKKEKPSIVLVEGDTNTALSGALVSAKLDIPVGHVEAGLRSYDRRMPEEYNRIICDHIAEYLFVPTKLAKENLLKEGISEIPLLYNGRTTSQKIFLVGNTVVDAILQNLRKADDSQILSTLGLTKEAYFLITAHRQENVDNKDCLLGIIKGLQAIANSYNMPLVYPIHPRTKNKLEEFNLIDELNQVKGMKVIEPLGFFDFLALESNARLVLTDSGGLQEEACSLQVPCVVLREKSDRPESIKVGASMLAGCNPKKILEATNTMMQKDKNWKSPFGDGKAGDRIVEIILKSSL